MSGYSVSQFAVPFRPTSAALVGFYCHMHFKRVPIYILNFLLKLLKDFFIFSAEFPFLILEGFEGAGFCCFRSQTSIRIGRSFITVHLI